MSDETVRPAPVAADVEALARALVEARLLHFGYDMEWIKAHEDPPDHATFGCELISGYGWQCDDEDAVSRHPDHDTYAAEADNVMFVLEAAPLTDWLAGVVATARAEERERIAQAIESRRPPLWRIPINDAAAIARAAREDAQ
jgi:hypothetical protein